MSDATSLAPLEGGCLCGHVRYEARPGHRDGYYCHCRMCRLAVGNTRAAWFNLKKSEVTWLAEPAWFVSSQIARRAFCNRCGTPLAFAFDDSPNIDVTVGSLDDPSRLKPVAHYSTETRLPAWHCDDGLPGHRLDENEPINRRWRKAYGDDVTPGLEATRSHGSRGVA